MKEPEEILEDAYNYFGEHIALALSIISIIGGIYIMTIGIMTVVCSGTSQVLLEEGIIVTCLGFIILAISIGVDIVVIKDLKKFYKD